MSPRGSQAIAIVRIGHSVSYGPKPLTTVGTAPRRTASSHVGLERDDIAVAQPFRSNSLFDRVLQTFGDSAYSHHALVWWFRRPPYCGAAVADFGTINHTRNNDLLVSLSIRKFARC